MCVPLAPESDSSTVLNRPGSVSSSAEHPGSGPVVTWCSPAPPPPLSTAHPPSRLLELSGDMDGVPDIIHISISLRIQPNEGPVFYKVDGTRFGQTRTIKLLTGSKYKIEVVMKPGTVEAT